MILSVSLATPVISKGANQSFQYARSRYAQLQPKLTLSKCFLRFTTRRRKFKWFCGFIMQPHKITGSENLCCNLYLSTLQKDIVRSLARYSMHACILIFGKEHVGSKEMLVSAAIVPILLVFLDNATRATRTMPFLS